MTTCNACYSWRCQCKQCWVYLPFKDSGLTLNPRLAPAIIGKRNKAWLGVQTIIIIITETIIIIFIIDIIIIIILSIRCSKSDNCLLLISRSQNWKPTLYLLQVVFISLFILQVLLLFICFRYSAGDVFVTCIIISINSVILSYTIFTMIIFPAAL